MLLSDRDIRAAHAEGHISLDPWTDEMVQPASIDVSLDRFFRLFNNHAYTYVDPAENQGELTEQFEVGPDEPWILHPGEFALGSTWEYVKIDETLAALTEEVKQPAVVGDIPALQSQLEELRKKAAAKKDAIAKARKEAMTKAIAERTSIVEKAEALAAGLGDNTN